MALLMISGLPTSGKTYRARQLAEQWSTFLVPTSEASPSISTTAAPLQPTAKTAPPDPLHSRTALTKRIRHVTHISEHTLGLSRSSFATAAKEKLSRAAVYSACKRALARDTVVILDAGNYIKGYRYQLYCEAKNLGLRSAVLYCGTTIEQARGVNTSRLERAAKDDTLTVGGSAEAEPYDEKVWEELVMRFEEPNDAARWDKPLYTVLWDDPDLGEPGGRGDTIWEEAVLGISKDGKLLDGVRPNAAAVAPREAGEGVLAELERVTTEVVKQVGDIGSMGGDVAPIDLTRLGVEGAGSSEKLVVRLPAGGVPSFAQLQRMRRQFVQLQRSQAGGLPLRRQRLGGLFVDWLNDQFEAI